MGRKVRIYLLVFYIQYLDVVIKILKSVCLRCSKLLVDKHDEEISEIMQRMKGKKKKGKKFDDKIQSKIYGKVVYYNWIKINVYLYAT